MTARDLYDALPPRAVTAAEAAHHAALCGHPTGRDDEADPEADVPGDVLRALRQLVRAGMVLRRGSRWQAVPVRHRAQAGPCECRRVRGEAHPPLAWPDPERQRAALVIGRDVLRAGALRQVAGLLPPGQAYEWCRRAGHWLHRRAHTARGCGCGEAE